jgi:formyltetrahydrofolate-dependent phosphoribosylglycinamide formyltransferase
VSKPRVVVLISGSGSNLQALIDASRDNILNAEIVLVVSNRKAAFGLERAKNASIETLYFPLKPYRNAGHSREEYDTDLASSIAAFKPDLIVCAGWMHIDSGALIERFPNRIINLHPALPGQFPGAHGIEDAFKAWLEGRITHSGCMVHHVIKDLDAGEPIATREIPFEPNETLESYSNKIHKAEHEIIVQATKMTLETLQP